MTGCRALWRRVTSFFDQQSNQDDIQYNKTFPEAENGNSDNSWLLITKSDSKTQRREKLKKCFLRNEVVMTVREQDLIAGNEPGDDDTDFYRGRLVLPRCEKGYGASTVPNCCVICLDSYQPDDMVVWSVHPECQHAFHQECVLKYLVRIQTKVAMTPCCVCRCNFTDLEVQAREKHVRRRGRGGRRTVRTQHNFDALELPSWWISSSRSTSSSPQELQSL